MPDTGPAMTARLRGPYMVDGLGPPALSPRSRSGGSEELRSHDTARKRRTRTCRSYLLTLAKRG